MPGSMERLTTLVAAPFFLLVGSGGSWWRRGWSAGLGAAIPVGALLAYNIAVTGQVFGNGKSRTPVVDADEIVMTTLRVREWRAIQQHDRDARGVERPNDPLVHVVGSRCDLEGRKEDA